MEQKNYEPALENLARAQEVNPKNPEVFLYRGKLELLREKYSEAAELEKAIGMDPKNAYAHYYAGLAYSKTGRPHKATSHFQTFLKLAPNAPEAAKVKFLLRGIR